MNLKHSTLKSLSLKGATMSQVWLILAQRFQKKEKRWKWKVYFRCICHWCQNLTDTRKIWSENFTSVFQQKSALASEMVKTRDVVFWHQMEKDQNQNIRDWSVVAYGNKTRHLHVRTTCWPEQCPMSYKERIEYGKHFISLWQLVTLRPKGITPFHLLMNFESQCNPFKTLVSHGLKKLELTMQPEYKI